MTRCAGPDGRVRGQIQYYGASRTGRFAGRLIQVQNFPRPTLPKKDLSRAVSDIKRGYDRDWLDAVYGQPLDIVAQALRSCIVPGAGKVFVTYDFKQIEARVLAWLAGAHGTLKAFVDGEDVYVREQKRIGLSSRLAGKVVVLACGYQMGPARFQATAKTYGLDLDLNQAKTIVEAWREANPEIVSLWHRVGDTFRQALRTPGPVAVNSKMGFIRRLEPDGKVTIAMTLPSGRYLYYRNVRIMPGKYPGGELTYNGVDQTTKRWDVIKTYGGKLVENWVQAVARDCLVDAALRIEKLGLGELVVTVHDELVEEVEAGMANARMPLILAEVEKSPDFAPDLPIAAEGGIRTSYGV
jgi:DNA polymerase